MPNSISERNTFLHLPCPSNWDIDSDTEDSSFVAEYVNFKDDTMLSESYSTEAPLMIRLDEVHASERQDGGASMLALASDKEGADEDKLRPLKLSSWMRRRLLVADAQIVTSSCSTMRPV